MEPSGVFTWMMALLTSACKDLSNGTYFEFPGCIGCSKNSKWLPWLSKRWHISGSKQHRGIIQGSVYTFLRSGIADLPLVERYVVAIFNDYLGLFELLVENIILCISCSNKPVGRQVVDKSNTSLVLTT